MSTLNLSPKNPIVLGALVIGAYWLFSRRGVANAATVRPAPVGASTVNGTVAPAINALASLFGSLGSLGQRSGSAYGVPDEQARAAVRAGDPYYGGGAAVAGSQASWLDQMAVDAQAWDTVDYYSGSTGDPYNQDGGYWLN